MFRRPLVLLCLGYVVLDFGNPLMRGAVSLSDGFVEGARAERRLEDAEPLPSAGQPPAVRTDADLTVAISARPASNRVARPQVRTPVKRLAPASSPPPSSLSEDH